jgi:hypothetical protein
MNTAEQNTDGLRRIDGYMVVFYKNYHLQQHTLEKKEIKS